MPEFFPLDITNIAIYNTWTVVDQKIWGLYEVHCHQYSLKLLFRLTRDSSIFAEQSKIRSFEPLDIVYPDRFTLMIYCLIYAAGHVQ